MVMKTYCDKYRGTNTDGIDTNNIAATSSGTIFATCTNASALTTKGHGKIYSISLVIHVVGWISVGVH